MNDQVNASMINWAYINVTAYSSHSSEWYQAIAGSGILKDTYFEVKFPYANNASHNGFGSTKDSTDIIDHIFITNHFTAIKWGLLTNTYHRKFPSDHFPVLAEIILK